MVVEPKSNWNFPSYWKMKNYSSIRRPASWRRTWVMSNTRRLVECSVSVICR